MALIPKGPNQGKILVWGANMPVLLKPHFDPNYWFCQAWAIIDPNPSASVRIKNYLLPISPRSSPVSLPGVSGLYEPVPSLFCSGHAWSQNGDLVVGGGDTVYRNVQTAAPYDPPQGTPTLPANLQPQSKFLFLFDPFHDSAPFPGQTTSLYPGEIGRWIPGPSLVLDRYYPTVALSQKLTRNGANGQPLNSEEAMVAGGSDWTGTAELSYELYQIGAFNPNQPNASVFVSDLPAATPTRPPVYGGPNDQFPSDDERLGLYPRLQLVSVPVPNSSPPTSIATVFMSGTRKLSSRVDLNDPPTRVWDLTVGRNPSPTFDFTRHDGASVLACLPGISVCVRLGGGDEISPNVLSGTDTAEFCRADLSGTAVAWEPLPTPAGKEEMPGGPRQFPNALMLPDGSILVIGGADPAQIPPSPGTVPQSAYVRKTVLYRPNIGWDEVSGADTPTRRAYHSTAVLLPDGRVFVGGGELLGVSQQSGEFDYDIYSPHYLQGNPTRPEIVELLGFDPNSPTNPNPNLAQDSTGTATVVSNNQIIQVLCEDLGAIGQIDRLVLMAPGSITHHSDMSARYILLESQTQFGAGSSKRLARIPDNGTAPRGYYMMFAVSNSGIPSVAKWIQVQ